jgi:hypothetical protein
MSVDDAAEFFQTRTLPPTPEEETVTGLYQAGMQWNDWLRSGNVNEYAREKINTLTGYIDRQPVFGEPVNLYRGVSRKLLDQLQPGATFRDEGFMSTTLDPSTAHLFAGTGTDSPIIQIIARPKDRGLSMNVARHPDQTGIPEEYRQHANALDHEAEVLLRPGTTLKVASVEQGQIGGATHTIVKAVIVDG